MLRSVVYSILLPGSCRMDSVLPCCVCSDWRIGLKGLTKDNIVEWLWSQKSFFVICFIIFGIDRAQTTIDFEMHRSNWPIETFRLRYLTAVWTLQQRINCARSQPFQHKLQHHYYQLWTWQGFITSPSINYGLTLYPTYISEAFVGGYRFCASWHLTLFMPFTLL